MPKAFSDSEKQIITQRLVQTGSKLFAQYGLQKTRVEELAAATGISKGAFYLFYPSKEMLFMDVIEEAEKHFRQEVLATLGQPGLSPRTQLFAALSKAFTLWKTIPILRFFTHADYEILARRIPPETLQAHLHSDRGFVEELIEACHSAGIAISVTPAQFDGLLHALFFASLHEDDLGVGKLSNALETLLMLTVAYALGDVTDGYIPAANRGVKHKT